MWNLKWNHVMKSLRFETFNSDSCILRGVSVIILVYVDIIAIYSDRASILSFVREMRAHHNIYSLWRIKFFLGKRIQPTTDLFTLCKSTFTKYVSRRFKMENFKPVRTPMVVREVVDDDKWSLDKNISWDNWISTVNFVQDETGHKFICIISV